MGVSGWELVVGSWELTTMTRRFVFFVIFAAFVASVLSVRTLAQVTSDRLLRASEEPQNWITYSGGYAGRGKRDAGRGGQLRLRSTDRGVET